MDKEIVRKILQYAINGMCVNLREAQEQILLAERFGGDAVLSPNLHNPKRQVSTLDKRLKRVEELTLLLNKTQEALDKVLESEMDESADYFKKHFKL